jgi:ADP-ribose pyrophosphatase YjhB (NUDIX family)
MTEQKYLQGYSFAVGGIVLFNQKVLLVRRAAGGRVGDWQIPGGLVETNETLFTAVKREISEETGIQAEVKGLVAILNRALAGENNTYFIFLLDAITNKIKIDGIEIDDARFCSLDEINKLPHFQSLSQLVVSSALQNKSTVLQIYPHPEIPLSEGLLCAGDDVQDEFSQISHLLWYSPKVGETIV